MGLDTGELLEALMTERGLHNLEGDQGLDHFTAIARVLGYQENGLKYGSPLEQFLADNSGALGAVIEWIGQQDLPEWQEKLAGAITETAEPEEPEEPEEEPKEYRVAVYWLDYELLRHPHGIWKGLAGSEGEAIELAKNALRDERIELWDAEVLPALGEEEEPEEESDEEDFQVIAERDHPEFAAAYRRLAARGESDSWGGMESRRVYGEWLKAGKPLPAREFIEEMV